MDRGSQPAQETGAGHDGPETRLPTSLRGIANKARREPQHRFRDLYGMLTEAFLHESWRWVRKNAASGVDRVSAREYARELTANIRGLVERLKQKRYRAQLVRRQWIPKGKDKLRPLGIPVVEDKLLQRAVRASSRRSSSRTSCGAAMGTGQTSAPGRPWTSSR